MSRARWLDGLKTRLRTASRSRPARRGRPRPVRAAAAETLEDRIVLAAPTGMPDSYTADRDVLTVPASGVLANDMDFDGHYPLTAVLDAGPSHGSLTLNANGSFTYTPTANYVGADSFTYKAKDTTNASSSAVTVSLTVTKPYGARLNADDLPEAGAQAYGAFAASLFTGDVSAAHAVAPGHTLAYSAFAAAPKPVIAAEADYSPGFTAPGSTKATLTYDGTAGTPVWYASAMMGQRVRFALQADATARATGRYAWSMEVMANYSGGATATRTYAGYDHVVNRSGSEFSSGWTLAELDRLHVQSGGVLFVSGTGVAAWFASNGSGGYVSPPGGLNFSTLTLSGGVYTLTDKHGNAEAFSSTGLLTSRVDRNGNTVAYAYTDADSDGISDEISTITDPFGRVTTFGYASGKVTSVTDIAGRVTSVGYDGSGRLSTVTRPDPDGAGSLTAPVTTYAYATGTSRLTSVTDPLSHATTIAHDFAGRVSQATYHDATDRDFANWQTRGLVNLAGGTGTSGSPATLYMPTTVTSMTQDELNRSTKTTYDRFGNVLAHTDPLSNVTAYVRDANGLVTQVTQPDPDAGGALAAPVTGFAYDAKGNLLTLTNPGGSTQTFTYHSTHNQVLTATNELNKTTTYTHDADGNVLTATDPLGHVTTFTYDGRGQVLTVTRPDPDGAGSLTAPVTTFAYDSYGRLTTTTNPDSSTVVLAYNTADQVTSRTDELSRVTTYAYDALDRLTSVTLPDPDGAGALASPVMSYAYDAAGRLTSTTDPLGKATTYAYDVRDRLTSTTLPDPDGAGSLTAPAYGRSYNAAGQLLTETDPLGKVTTYAYDGGGRLSTVTRPDPDGAGSLTAPVTAYGYDHLSRVTTVTDPLSNVTAFEYDARGRRTKVTAADPDGMMGSLTSPVTLYAYDNAGRLASETNPLGKVTAYAYDDANRLTSITLPDPDGAGSLTSPVVSYGYDHLDRRTTETDPLSKVTAYAYDSRDRLTSVTQPDPDGAGSLASPVTTYAYDVASQLTSLTDPLGKVTAYGYDLLGRTTSTTLPDPDGAGSLTSPVYQTTYDGRGNVASTTDPLGKVTTYAYDFLSRLTSKTDPDPDGAGSLASPVTTYAYDAAGRMTSLVDPVGNDTTWTYDALGRVTAETNDLAETRTFAYDAASNVTVRTDRNGRVTEYVYDKLNRRTTERWKTGGTTVNTITSVYDAASQLTSVTDGSSVYAYTYDGLGRVLTVNNDGTSANLDLLLTNVYDAAGGRTSLATTVNGTADLQNEWQYDDAGRVTRVTQHGQTGGNAVADKRVDLAYDAAGRFASITRYEDLAGTALAAATAYSFDAAGRLTALGHTKGATSLASYTWTYDANGRLTAATSVDGSTSYAYDAGGQLTGADHNYQTDETYSYDANGNRANTGYTVGTNNRVTTDGTYNYAYDDEGNRTRKTTISTGAYVDYAWDHRNRLTAVTYKTYGGTKTKEVTYKYDAFDRRIAKDVDSNGDGTVDAGEQYAYDGGHVLIRASRSGAVTNRYLHGPEVDQVFADESTTDGLLWALADSQGTVRDWVDHHPLTDTTTVADHLKFDGFGRITAQSSGTHQPLFAYTGREWDADAGLYYYRARWYDPGAGEFLSEDPAGFAARDTNLGRYVGNGPTYFVDPSGLAAEGYPGGGLNPINWLYYPLYDVTLIGYNGAYNNYATSLNIRAAESAREARLVGLDPDNASSDEARRALRATNQNPVPEDYEHLIETAETSVAGTYGNYPGALRPIGTGLAEGGAAAGLAALVAKGGAAGPPPVRVHTLLDAIPDGGPHGAFYRMFHGTSETGAQSILQGIDASRLADGQFYLTTNPAAAADYARTADLANSRAAVIEFNMPKEDFLRLMGDGHITLVPHLLGALQLDAEAQAAINSTLLR